MFHIFSDYPNGRDGSAAGATYCGLNLDGVTPIKEQLEKGITIGLHIGYMFSDRLDYYGLKKEDLCYKCANTTGFNMQMLAYIVE